MEQVYRFSSVCAFMWQVMWPLVFVILPQTKQEKTLLVEFIEHFVPWALRCTFNSIFFKKSWWQKLQMNFFVYFGDTSRDGKGWSSCGCILYWLCSPAVMAWVRLSGALYSLCSPTVTTRVRLSTISFPVCSPTVTIWVNASVMLLYAGGPGVSTDLGHGSVCSSLRGRLTGSSLTSVGIHPFWICCSLAQTSCVGLGKSICLESVTVDRKMFVVAARKITSLITYELVVGKLEWSPAETVVQTAAREFKRKSVF